jgi:transposase
VRYALALRYGSREQVSLLPPSIEEYVCADDPVRVYDAFVDQLDISALGLRVDEDEAGHPRYDPVSMLKLLVYGSSYGERSGRRLERATHHNLSFIWLVGGLKPDYRTIARFRRANQQPLRRVLKQCAQMCLRIGLIDGNVLFVDSTRMKANASKDATWDAKRCGRVMKAVEHRIDELLKECEEVDREEESQGSLIKIREELADKRNLLAQVRSIAAEIAAKPKPKEGSASVNTTDPNSVRIKSRRGSNNGYSAHLVTDEKHGLIVSSDVVPKNNDSGEFSTQVRQAERTLGDTCDTAVADAGYHDLGELTPIAQRGTRVLVPTQAQAAHSELGPYDKTAFVYDAKQDCYFCPQGHRLRRVRRDTKKSKSHYCIAGGSTCQGCIGWGICTKSKHGRTVTRFFDEHERETLMKEYEREESRRIFAKRKVLAERPFGHIRNNLGFNSFLLRGIDGVQAEMALIANAFNIRRLITICGARSLIALMRAI